MSATVIFSALACGVVVWFLVASRLTAKSWESQDERGDVGAIHAAPQRIGLWIFMAVVTSLFSLFISAYAMRMHAGAWCSIAIPDILWVNSLVLVGASVAMQRSRWAADHGSRSGARSALVVADMLYRRFPNATEGELSRSLIDRLSRQNGMAPKRLTDEALAWLGWHRWPGNIRELRNTLESAFVMAPGDVIDRSDLAAAMGGEPVRPATAALAAAPAANLETVRPSTHRPPIRCRPWTVVST